MNIEVRIRKIINDDKPLKAIASATIGSAFAIHDIKIVQLEKRTIVAMPYKEFTDKDGNNVRKDICHPITSEARKQLEEAVLTAYEQKINQ